MDVEASRAASVAICYCDDDGQQNGDDGDPGHQRQEDRGQCVGRRDDRPEALVDAVQLTRRLGRITVDSSQTLLTCTRHILQRITIYHSRRTKVSQFHQDVCVYENYNAHSLITR